MLYPSGYHASVTSSSGADASAASDGNLVSHSEYLGSTRSTCVCCSMISETRMWYGSSVLRHGRSRPFLRYHASRLRRNRWRRGCVGSGFDRGLANGAYNLIVKIYTKTGDSGDTSLFDGTRVSKTDPRVVAYGDVDELQACIGVVRSIGLPDDLDEMCETIQRDLFALGARLADPAHKIAKRVEKIVIDDDSVTKLEGWID